jgi:hypothetical protein
LYLKRWELCFHHLDEALAGGKPFEGAVFAADMLDFEKRWSDLHDHHPCQVADASIRLRGQFTLEAWDLHAGQFSVPAYSNTVEAGQSVTVIKLSLSPVHLYTESYIYAHHMAKTPINMGYSTHDMRIYL